MGTDRREIILNNLKLPLKDYTESFMNFLSSCHEIKKLLESETELLTLIHKEFNNLSAAVELEFEGTSVIEEEIKKVRNLHKQGSATVAESMQITLQITTEFETISKSFEKIKSEISQLQDIVKNINMVSDSLEVASRNAGITAFHAGRKGRGFEIIAQQMTDLVRHSQQPTKRIPELSARVISGVEIWESDLNKVSNIVHYLKETNNKFSKTTQNLTLVVPKIEEGIKAIAQSIETQRELHNLLLKENAKLHNWTTELYDTARVSAILELSLEMLFQQINNLKDSLIKVQDEASFYYLYNSLKIALLHASRSYDKITKGFAIIDFGKLNPESLNKFILQFISETNRLLGIIEDLHNEIKNWLNLNELAFQVLSKGNNFYQDISEILTELNKKVISVQRVADEIAEPLKDLKKIVERSKILGLYAGIESARGGEYATSLGVVTNEIKGLSQKTTSFMLKVAQMQAEVKKDFSRLFPILIKGINNVEQGTELIKSAIESFEKNKLVLENLFELTEEMINSTNKAITQCAKLSDNTKSFNLAYEKSLKEYERYAATINDGTKASNEILNIINKYSKEVSILEKRKKRITIRETTDPIILDPANKTDATSHQIIEQIFIGLLTFDSANHLIHGIADSFSVSKDGREWNFILKEGIKFHNGKLLTAADVLDSMERVKNSSNAFFIDYVDDIKILSETSIKFALRYPYLPFLSNLACGVCDITPQRFSAENPIGCGPYRFIHWEKGKEIVLETFEDFFDGRPPIDEMVIKIIPDDNEAVELFKKGEISILPLSPNTMKEFKPDEIITGPILSTQYLCINVAEDTPFRDVRVRQAMNYVIDKDYYVKSLMANQAIPAKGIFPPGIFGYNKNLQGYPYNLDKAQQLMREAGFSNHSNEIFPLDIRDTAEVIKRADYFRECFAKIGIKLKLNPMPWKDLLDKGYRGESLLTIKGWVSDNGDPDNFLYPLFHSKSFGRAGNTSFYQREKVDDLIEKARAEPNSKRRKDLYQTVEKYIVEDPPWVFITHGLDSYIIANDVQGFKVDPFGLIRTRDLWST